MSNLRRYFAPNRTYFITSVTYKRIPILRDHENLLIRTLYKIADKLEFNVISYVVLPDHFHTLITQSNDDPSKYIKRVKLSFSQKIRIREKYTGRMWQLRYWDHVIRDQRDFNKHLDYIHFNPVKHGYVINPFNYRFSSLKSFAENGHYVQDWGSTGELEFEGDYGEY